MAISTIKEPGIWIDGVEGYGFNRIQYLTRSVLFNIVEQKRKPKPRRVGSAPKRLVQKQKSLNPKPFSFIIRCLFEKGKT